MIPDPLRARFSLDSPPAFRLVSGWTEAGRSPVHRFARTLGISPALREARRMRMRALDPGAGAEIEDPAVRRLATAQRERR